MILICVYVLNPLMTLDKLHQARISNTKLGHTAYSSCRLYKPVPTLPQSMSDFFAGVHGARFPDVVMNKGPLPGTGGLPAPLHDTVDGRINYNSSLLGDIEPYAYGEPGYL